MPRRLAMPLIVLLVASAALAGTALGTPQDVIDDYRDNGVIDRCHARSDYEAARSIPIDIQYGDPGGAIDDAVANPTLVGTDARPCPAAPAADDGSGVGTAALAAVPIAAVVLGGAIVLARRRRRGDEGGGHDGPATGE